MKNYSIFLFVTFLVISCSSPESNQQSHNTQSNEFNMAELSTPDTSNYSESKVYVDSVKPTQQGLLISGNLPDGCSKLHKASHTLQGDSLRVTLTAWRPADKMCTQALTPFKFMYEKVSSQQIENITVVAVNDKAFEL